MAGGIDWFRWHHGSVTDPKFQLVAKKAGVRLGDVIAVWAFVLEKASADADRGAIGPIDLETLDFLLGTDEGTAARILDAMTQRGLIDGSRVAAWDKRQPKRERDADSSTERTRAYRERQKAAGDADSDDVTPSDATEHQGTPREEKSREEKKKNPPTPQGGASVEVPDWIPAEPWSEFVAMRRAKGQRTPFTVGAARGVLTKLAGFRDAGHDLAEVLRQSTVNGWADVYEPKAKPAPAAGVTERFI